MNKRLETWLRRHLFTVRKGQRCTGLALKHVTAHGKSRADAVGFWEVPEGPDDDFLVECCRDIDQAMLDDSQGVRGSQSYALHAHYNSEKPEARITFRVDSEDDIETEGYHTDPPTKSGMLGQLMRHNEALMRQLVIGQSATQQYQARVISRLSEQNESMQAQRIQMFETYERLASMDHDRQLETRREESRERMLQEGLQTVKALAPAIMARRAAANGDNEGAVVIAAKTLRDSITPDQFEKLQSTLGPQQLALVMEMFNAAEPH